MNHEEHNKAFWLSSVLVGFSTLFYVFTNPVLDVDAAQFATMSLEMLQKGEYLEVYERGHDYLDKPPLIFWLTTLSFSLFGNGELAYRLVGFLAFILGVFYTYRLASKLHDEKSAKLSILILISTSGWLWALSDLKTDILVASFMIMTVYHLREFAMKCSWRHIALAGLGTGLGMLSKGMMALIFPLVIFFVFVLFTKRGYRVLRPHWILYVLIASLTILPMCYGLYTQFDLNPDKWVNGKQGVSGLRFFFWEQSFGRITGENYWRNDTSFFFLFHSALLLIFPYSFILIVAVVKCIRNFQVDRIWDCGSAIIILFLLSFSQYKIPQYAVIALPFFSVILGRELGSGQFLNSRWARIHSFILLGIVMILSLFTLWVWQVDTQLLMIIFLGCVIIGVSFWINSIVYQVLSFGVFFALLFHGIYFNKIDEYLIGEQVANLIQKNDIDLNKLRFYNLSPRSVEFYLNSRIPIISGENIINNCGAQIDGYYIMSEDGREGLINAGLKVLNEYHINFYDFNRIDWAFVNPSTRREQLEKCFLIQFDCSK